MAKTHRVNKMDEEMLEEVPLESTEEEEETMEEESDEENSRLFGNYDMTQAADTVGKKKKPGIIYLSSIPPGFNVSKTIMFFSEYGKIGRVFLQPDLKEKKQKNSKFSRNFTEGWVEFMSKKVAREVATNLNLAPVGGKKRSKSHDFLWNIKFLKGFKWAHLTERLAYEKASHQQKMRTEISQAKKEAEFFKTNVEKSRKRSKKKTPIETTDDDSPRDSPAPRVYEFRQKDTDEAIQRRKRGAASPDEAASSSKKKKKGKMAAAGKSRKRKSESEDSSDRLGLLRSVFSN